LNTVRIFVGELPRMMRAIVEDAVGEQADMQIVASGPADVAIVADSGAGRLGPEQRLLENPRLKVFALSADGRAARLLEIRETPVVPVSRQGLIDAIRTATAAGHR